MQLRLNSRRPLTRCFSFFFFFFGGVLRAARSSCFLVFVSQLKWGRLIVTENAFYRSSWRFLEVCDQSDHQGAVEMLSWPLRELCVLESCSFNPAQAHQRSDRFTTDLLFSFFCPSSPAVTHSAVALMYVFLSFTLPRLRPSISPCRRLTDPFRHSSYLSSHLSVDLLYFLLKGIIFFWDSSQQTRHNSGRLLKTDVYRVLSNEY